MAQSDMHIAPWGTVGPDMYTGLAAPTSGTYKRGDWCINTAPTSGGTAAWICVTAGTPGTWKAVALQSS